MSPNDGDANVHKTPTKPPAFKTFHDTPYKLNTHKDAGLAPRAVPITQNQMLPVMANELGNANVASKRLHDAITCPLNMLMKINKQKYSKALKAMAKAMANVRGKDARFWSVDHEETDYYGPVMRMISAALKTAKGLIPTEDRGYAGDLSFHAYDRPVKNRDGGSDLKPDGVGMLGLEELKEGDVVHWEDIHCIYEAKTKAKYNTYAAIQGSTYARLIFTHQPNRTLVYGLLHQCASYICFARFDRAGCTRTEEFMDISTSNGRTRLSEILASMITLPPLHCGIDETMCPDGTAFTLNNLICDIKGRLAYRECVRGHATRAYLVEVRKKLPGPIDPRTSRYEKQVITSSSEGENKTEDGEGYEGRVQDPYVRCSSMVGLGLVKVDAANTSVAAKKAGAALPTVPGPSGGYAGGDEAAEGSSRRQTTDPPGPESLDGSSDVFSALSYESIPTGVKAAMSSSRRQSTGPPGPESFDVFRDVFSAYSHESIPSSVEVINGKKYMDGALWRGDTYPGFFNLTEESENSRKRKNTDDVDDESEAGKAKKRTRRGKGKKKSTEKENKIDNRLVRPKPPKDWNALFVGVENFDESHIDKPFIVKESYANDVQKNDREGIAIADLRDARVKVKEGSADVPEIIALGDCPSAASLCDYGSRIPVKGIGYLADAKRAEGEEVEDDDEKGPVPITTRLLNPDAHDNRTLIRQVIWTVGQPLVNAESPQDLIRVFRDIFYGQYNLVKLGYVHRDISSGNCFFTEKRKGVVFKKCERDPVTKQLLRVTVEKVIESTGLVADLDRVVLFEDIERPVGHHRTGTLPFMAMYICKHPIPRHSPVHDCESTFWLIIWVISFITLRITEDEGVKKDIVIRFINAMRPVSWKVEESAAGKRGLLAILIGPGVKDEMPVAFHPFIPVLRELGKLVRAYHKKSKEYHELGRTFTQNQAEVCLESCIKVIEENMPKETSWDYINTGEVETKYEEIEEIILADQ